MHQVSVPNHFLYSSSFNYEPWCRTTIYPDSEKHGSIRYIRYMEHRKSSRQTIICFWQSDARAWNGYEIFEFIYMGNIIYNIDIIVIYKCLTIEINVVIISRSWRSSYFWVPTIILLVERQVFGSFVPPKHFSHIRPSIKNSFYQLPWLSESHENPRNIDEELKLLHCSPSFW